LAIAYPYVDNQPSTGVLWSVNTYSEILNIAALPYLLLVDLVNSPDVYQARIVSAGDDGEFERHEEDEENEDDDSDYDNCSPVDTNEQTLDQVLCLLN